MTHTFNPDLEAGSPVHLSPGPHLPPAAGSLMRTMEGGKARQFFACCPGPVGTSVPSLVLESIGIPAYMEDQLRHPASGD